VVLGPGGFYTANLSSKRSRRREQAKEVSQVHVTPTSYFFLDTFALPRCRKPRCSRIARWASIFFHFHNVVQNAGWAQDNQRVLALKISVPGESSSPPPFSPPDSSESDCNIQQEPYKVAIRRSLSVPAIDGMSKNIVFHQPTICAGNSHAASEDFIYRGMPPLFVLEKFYLGFQTICAIAVSIIINAHLRESTKK